MSEEVGVLMRCLFRCCTHSCPEITRRHRPTRAPRCSLPLIYAPYPSSVRFTRHPQQRELTPWFLFKTERRKWPRSWGLVQSNRKLALGKACYGTQGVEGRTVEKAKRLVLERQPWERRHKIPQRGCKGLQLRAELTYLSGTHLS